MVGLHGDGGEQLGDMCGLEDTRVEVFTIILGDPNLVRPARFSKNM